eukprot:TRINITY_DN57699_c0_g1_i1.p1 TRINITY_DN57699_c0_g1~~TRINITY_DN57699_c0_g1_i1.p1  ORF type:complete len:580 (+),score=102.64 TRINITY_DN57699_c0_g1_i1:55-1740(+)
MEPIEVSKQHKTLLDIRDLAKELACSLAVDSWPGGGRLAAQLRHVESVTSQLTRVFVAGGSNAGKSSLCNFLLGEKVWPVTPFALSCRPGEATYGVSRVFSVPTDSTHHNFQVGEGVPICSMKLPAASALCPSAFRPVRAWLPSALLRAGVILVDMPSTSALEQSIAREGGDLGDNAYMIVYVVDVNSWMSSVDLTSLERLVEATPLASEERLMVLINKCDRRSKCCSDDEEDEDYDSLISQITIAFQGRFAEAMVCPMSLREARRGDPKAEVELASITRSLDESLAGCKAVNIAAARSALHDLMKTVQSTLNLELKRQEQLFEAKCKLEEAECAQPGKERLRAELFEKVRDAVHIHRDRHRRSIEQQCFRTEGETLTDENLVALKADIVDTISKMVQNDVNHGMSLRAETTTKLAVSKANAVDVAVVGSLAALPVAVSAVLYSALSAGLLGISALLPITLGAVVPAATAAYWLAGLDSPHITREMKMHLFDELYFRFEEGGLHSVVESLVNSIEQHYQDFIAERRRHVEDLRCRPNIDVPDKLSLYRRQLSNLMQRLQQL